MKYQIPEHVRSIIYADGATIMNTAKDTILSINITGALIWSGIGRAETVEEITRNLAMTCSVDPKETGPDVIEFLSQLEHHGLISKAE